MIIGLLGKCSLLTSTLEISLHWTCLAAGIWLYLSINKGLLRSGNYMPSILPSLQTRVSNLAAPEKSSILQIKLKPLLTWPHLSLQCVILQIKFSFLMPSTWHCVWGRVKDRHWRTQLISRGLEEHKPTTSLPVENP